MFPEPRVKVVPPTARTLGETEGNIGPDHAPGSPEAATNATLLWPAGVVNDADIIPFALEFVRSPAHRDHADTRERLA